MKQVKNENYLERVPKKNPAFRFTKDDKDLITIEIDNKGFFNRVLHVIPAEHGDEESLEL